MKPLEEMESAEIDGTTWYINRHGVVMRTKPDPILNFGSVLRFADQETEERVKEATGYVPYTCCHPAWERRKFLRERGEA